MFMLPRLVRTPEQSGIKTCKYCLNCQLWVPTSNFYPDVAKPDGFPAYCIECMKASKRKPR